MSETPNVTCTLRRSPSASPAISHGSDVAGYAMGFRLCTSCPADSLSVLRGVRHNCPVQRCLCRHFDGVQGSRVKQDVATEASVWQHTELKVMVETNIRLAQLYVSLNTPMFSD